MPSPFSPRSWRDTLILLRLPFSLFLLPVFLLAWSQAEAAPAGRVFALALIWHLLVYPASNGYNSWIDRDTEAIGGLAAPPPPPALLPWVCGLLDLLAVLWALSLGWKTALGVLGFILASRAYSAPWPRLKRYPWVSFATVFVFQGGWIYLTTVGALGPSVLGSGRHLLMALAASCLVGGSYPLSQIYQHGSDAQRGDLTLSRLLGIRGTLLFSGAVSGAGGLLLLVGLAPVERALVAVGLLPVLLRLGLWSRQIWQDPSRANHTQTMRTQLVGAICLCLSLGALVLLRF
ncbi:MAG: UbiA family prenyltransferase [Candidatus Sericytochromatia bacterium]